MRILITILALSVAAAASTAFAQPSPAGSRQERIDRARALFQQGVEAYGEGRLHEALEKLLRAQGTWRSPDLAFNIARCYERMGDAPRGIRWYRIYLRHGRPDATVRADVEGRIAALREMGRRQQDQIMTAPPSRDELTGESRVFFERGVAFFGRRQYGAAMQAFTAAYHFAPFPELVYNMALTSERLEQWRDAIDYYREYLRLQRRSPDRARVEAKIRQLRERRRR